MAGMTDKTDTPECIRIKPHHFVDVVTSFGKGQRTFEPCSYGHAVHTVSEKILADPDVLLEMDLGADDICRPCIHNIDGLCDDTLNSENPKIPSLKREWNLTIDERWSERLSLAQGDRLTAREFCRLVRDRAGDITDIYRETTATSVARRAASLNKGVEFMLAQP